MLAVENLQVSYKNVKAVLDVSLKVERGEMVALVGPNGAGKSSTLRAISGLIPTAGGRIYLEDKEITGCKPHEIARMGIAQVPEGRHLFGPLSVTDNLLLGGYTRTSSQTKKVLEYVWELFPRMYERRKQKVSTLSGGEQQMLAIGRALMLEPKLLILDEPSMGLAPQMVELIFETLKKLSKNGQTILLVEQNVNIAFEYSHRYYLLNLGRQILSGTPNEAEVQKDLLHTYLGENIT